jgi:hypothetical protein
MNNSATPPRFVPTLTDVVQLGTVVPEATDLRQSTGLTASPSMQGPVVNSFQKQNLPPVAQAITPAMTLETQLNLENEILHRVMQRVDVVLESRLQEAVAQIVLAHTQTLTPRLREEIESVVRVAVMQAVSQELYRKVF